MKRAAVDAAPQDPAGAFQYDAFLSYHRAADTRLAVALHHGLHRFARPWYRLRALHVFRDDASLAANPALWGSIEKALASSRHLILLACEASAESEWVTREVEYWCRHRDPGHLLIVLSDPAGDSPRLSWDAAGTGIDWSRTTALSASLRGFFLDEPRFVDMGWARARAELSLRDPAFQEALADLAAPMWGRPKDELIGADVREHRRTLRWVRVAVAALTTFALIASVAVVVAVGQRDTALDRTAVAEARQYAAESRGAADPYAALSLAVAAEERTTPALPEARSAFAAASRLAGTWTSRLVAKFTGRSAAGLSWSADGAELVAANLDDSSVDRWDVRSGRDRPGVPGLPDFFNDEVSADGSRVVSHSENRFVVRDVRAPGRRAGPFGVGPLELYDEVTDVALAPDGSTLATATLDGILRRWDAGTGRPIGPPERLRHVNELAWSPAHGRLATVGSDGVVIRDVASGRTVRAATTDEPYRLAWAPSGDRLAVAGTGWIQLVDARTGAVAAPLARDGADTDGAGGELAWSPDGRRLASGDTDIRVWDVATGRQIGDPLAIPDATVAWSPDSRFLAANSGNRFEVWEFAPPRAADDPLRGPADEIGAVAWSPAGTQVADASADGSIWVWDTRTRRPVLHLPQPDDTGNPVHAVAWSPDGRHLASASRDGIRVRDWPSRNSGPAPPIWASGGTVALAWSPEGARLLGGDARGTVRVWDVATGKRVGRTAQHDSATDPGGDVRWVGWPAGDHPPYTGSTDGTVRRWEAGTSTPAGDPVRIARSPLETMAFSPDGSVAAVGGDGAIHLLRTADGRPLRTIDGNDNGLTALAWSPDGTRLASSGPDDSIRIWDAGTGALLGQTIGTRADVLALAWSPDGTRLASGGRDGSTRLWSAMTEQSACRLVLPKLALTTLTRSAAEVGFDTCTRPEAVRNQPAVPILPVPG